MHVYDNLPEAINDLYTRGFVIDFNAYFNHLNEVENIESLLHAGLEIVEHYRFEANTNPSDSSVLYAIQTKNAEVKGILINAYGVYSEAFSDDIISQILVREAIVNPF